MKKNLFILPSAIYRIGDTTPIFVERLTQTLHSIESILSRVPGAEILLLDNSNSELPSLVYDIINHKEVTILRTYPILSKEIEDSFNFSKELTNDYLRASYIKNAIYSLTLSWYISNHDLSRYERVFIMSARYFLLNDFNLKDHDGKNIVLLKRMKSNFEEDLIKSKYQYKCVLFSFNTEIQEELYMPFSNINKYIESQWRSRKGVGDFEHGLSLYVPDHLIKEVDRNGICGRPNNAGHLVWI